MAKPDAGIKRLVRKLRDARLTSTEKQDRMIKTTQAAVKAGIEVRSQKAIHDRSPKRPPSGTSN